MRDSRTVFSQSVQSIPRQFLLVRAFWMNFLLVWRGEGVEEEGRGEEGGEGGGIVGNKTAKTRWTKISSLFLSPLWEERSGGR